MKYYIVGYTYSGKSTLGRKLAGELGVDVYDTDQMFEQRYHYTIRRFFAQFGEEAFRKLEREVLRATEAIDNAVISTGGGTPCYADNMDFLLQHGHVIYLRMSVDELVVRATNSRNPRPSMYGLGEEQIRSKIAGQLKEREGFYLRAHTIISSKDADRGVLAPLLHQ